MNRLVGAVAFHHLARRSTPAGESSLFEASVQRLVQYASAQGMVAAYERWAKKRPPSRCCRSHVRYFQYDATDFPGRGPLTHGVTERATATGVPLQTACTRCDRALHPLRLDPLCPDPDCDLQWDEPFDEYCPSAHRENK